MKSLNDSHGLHWLLNQGAIQVPTEDTRRWTAFLVSISQHLYFCQLFDYCLVQQFPNIFSFWSSILHLAKVWHYLSLWTIYFCFLCYNSQNHRIEGVHGLLWLCRSQDKKMQPVNQKIPKPQHFVIEQSAIHEKLATIHLHRLYFFFFENPPSPSAGANAHPQCSKKCLFILFYFFLGKEKSSFHDFYVTVWEQFYTPISLIKLRHMPVGISSFPYFLCIVLYAWQTSNQMKKNSLWPCFQTDS